MKFAIFVATILVLFVAACHAHCPTSYTPPPCIAQTFHWVERSGNEDFITGIATTEEDFSVGDVLTYRSDLYDSTGTNVIGKSQGQCILVDFADGVTYTYQCTFGLYVGRGSTISSIQLEGQYVESNVTTTDSLAITGGTGRFAGANGEVIQETIPQGEDFEYRYTVNLMTGFNCNCEQQEPALT